jgi:hypothetical protein
MNEDMENMNEDKDTDMERWTKTWKHKGGHGNTDKDIRFSIL